VDKRLLLSVEPSQDDMLSYVSKERGFHLLNIHTVRELMPRRLGGVPHRISFLLTIHTGLQIDQDVIPQANPHTVRSDLFVF
jgi:hypothetical protein